MEETSNPEAKLRRIQRLQPRLRDELDEARAELARLEVAHSKLDGHPGHDGADVFKVGSLKLLALLLVVVDILVQVLLNTGQLPDVAAWKVVLGSIGLALGITGGIHLVIMHLIHDPNRVPRTKRLCKVLAILAFTVIGVAGSIVLLYRQSGPDLAAYLFALVGVSWWIVAESLPVAAGAFSAWAAVLEEPVHAERAVRGARRRVRELEELMDRLQAEERRLNAGDAGGPSLSGPTAPDRRPVDVTRPRTGDGKSGIAPVPGTLVALVGLFSAAVMGNPTVGRAQDVVTSSAAASSHALTRGQGAPIADAAYVGFVSTIGLDSVAHVEVRDELCAVYTDRTRSVDPTLREEAVTLAIRRLPDILAAAGCGEVLAGSFSDEGPFTPRTWLQLPQEPQVVERCDGAYPETPARAEASVLVMFRGMRDHLRESAEEECRERNRDLTLQYLTDRRHFTDALKEAIDSPQLETARPTDIRGALDGLWTVGVKLAILITDGIDSGGSSAAPRVPDGVRLFLVLVPAKEEYGGRNATLEAAARWQEQGAATFPYPVLEDPAAWEIMTGR